MAVLAVEQQVFGATLPRVATRLPVGVSRGDELVSFAADKLKLELLPWQQWVLRAACVQFDGRWQSRTIGVLVARQNGKTRLATVRALGGMYLWGESVIAASQNRDVALDPWRDALELAEDADLGVHDVYRTNGRESFSVGKGRYKVVSATRRGGRGLSADVVICDETREYRDWDAFAALDKTRRARPTSQLWAISNEGDEGSVVLNALAEQGRAAALSQDVTDLAWFEYSAAGGLARTDVEAWRQSNPALGFLIPVETVASEARHDDPEVFETEVLCRRVVSLHPWLPAGSWDACGDFVRVTDDADVVFALDAGPELRHATIGVAWLRGDGVTHVEAVDSFDSSDGDVLKQAAERLCELVERWQPRAVLVVARSTSEAAALRSAGSSGTPVVSVSGADVVRAANAFHEAVLSRTLVHPHDPMTAAHVANVTCEGVLRRRSVRSDIDAAVALVLARHGAASQIQRVVSQDWVAF